MGSGSGSGSGRWSRHLLLTCAVLACIVFFLGFADLFLPRWESFNLTNVTRDDKPYDVSVYRGLFVCCVKYTDPNPNNTYVLWAKAPECLTCGELEDVSWEVYAALATFSFAVLCLALTALGSVLTFTFDRCRSKVNFRIYTACCIIAAFSSALTLIFYAYHVSWDREELLFGFYIGVAVSGASIILAGLFRSAQCVVHDECGQC